MALKVTRINDWIHLIVDVGFRLEIWPIIWNIPLFGLISDFTKQEYTGLVNGSFIFGNLIIEDLNQLNRSSKNLV
jgi:hypothetical protein